MVMPGQHTDTLSRLPVPNANRLIITGRDDPRVLVVEEDGAHVVEMAVQGEEAATLLVVPHADFVVVAARDEERLGRVEGHATHGA